MTHREKIAYFLSDIDRRSLLRWSYAPPVYRLLWAIGLPIRPPAFQSFLFSFLVWSVLIAGVFALLIGKYFPDMDKGPRWAIPIAIGMLIGLLQAAAHRRQARKLGNPSWEGYGTPTSAPRRGAQAR